MGRVMKKNCFQRQSWTEYLKKTLDFIEKSTPQEKSQYIAFSNFQ